MYLIKIKMFKHKHCSKNYFAPKIQANNNKQYVSSKDKQKWIIKKKPVENNQIMVRNKIFIMVIKFQFTNKNSFIYKIPFDMVRYIISFIKK